MRNITVFIEGNRKNLYLSENITVISDSETFIRCVSATIFWDYNNVISGVNDTFIHNENTITVPEGYWTVNMITRIRDRCVVYVNSQCYDVISQLFLEKSGSGGFSAYSSHVAYSINLGNFGTLLGFDKDTALAPKKRKLSQNSADLNRGLVYVTVSCDIVNEMRNVDTDGERSYVMATLPVPKGDIDMKRTVTQYSNSDSMIPVKGGCYNRLIFSVGTNIGDVGIGSILLELIIDDK